MSATSQTRIDAFLTNATDGAIRPQIKTLCNDKFLTMYSTKFCEPGVHIHGEQYDPDGNAICTEIVFEFGRKIAEPKLDIFVQSNGQMLIVAEVDRLSASKSTIVAKAHNLNDGCDADTIYTDAVPTDGVVSTFTPSVVGLSDGDFTVFDHSSSSEFDRTDIASVRG